MSREKIKNAFKTSAMNSIHLRLNGSSVEVFYEMNGNNPRILKVIRDGKDILSFVDKHSMDKFKKQIIKQY